MLEMQKKKSLKKLLYFLLAELVLVALVVVAFDPFYQYHEPWFGLGAVLNDRDNQMPGTIRNFEYDSVLVGSSVAENFDSAFLDETYGGTTLKIIRASGSTADLCYYLQQAHEKQELKQVFWCLDIFLNFLACTIFNKVENLSYLIETLKVPECHWYKIKILKQT